MKITISGTTGEGKSTLAAFLFEALELAGYKVDVDEESECDYHLKLIKDAVLRRSVILDLIKFQLVKDDQTKFVRIFQETEEADGHPSDAQDG